MNIALDFHSVVPRMWGVSIVWLWCAFSLIVPTHNGNTEHAVRMPFPCSGGSFMELDWPWNDSPNVSSSNEGRKFCDRTRTDWLPGNCFWFGRTMGDVFSRDVTVNWLGSVLLRRRIVDFCHSVYVRLVVCLLSYLSDIWGKIRSLLVWGVTSGDWKRRFGTTCSSHLQETALQDRTHRFSKTSVTTQLMLRNIPELVKIVFTPRCRPEIRISGVIWPNMKAYLGVT
jgi:hypothetical protein